MSAALQEAREEKRLIETILSRQLQEFTDRTGLHAININLSRTDVTTVGDEHQKLLYRVSLDIRIV